MTLAPARTRTRLHAPFWGYQALDPWVRRLLVALAAATLVLDSIFRATSDRTESASSAVVTTGIAIAVAMFAWRPPVGAVALIAIAVTGTVTGVTDTLLAGVAPLGLVAFCCSARLTIIYALTWTTWLVVSIIRPESTFLPLGGIIIAIVGVVSLLIGLAIRRQRERANTLSFQLEETEREVAEQLRHERDLIADELHDIVAHEITIVALHAAVLERTEDAAVRAQSQTAIREAAVQALTDIRRVLGMVRGEESLQPERVPAPGTLDDAVSSAATELRRAGIDVTIDVPPHLTLTGAPLLAVTRVIRESTTNVLKHATGARHVRMRVALARGSVHVEFADDSPPAQTAGLPSSGYGLMRLHERFRLFGGTFSSARRGGEWVVSASLPLTT